MTQRIVEVHVGVPGNTPLKAWADVGREAPDINSWQRVERSTPGQSHDRETLGHNVNGQLLHIATATGGPEDITSLVDQGMAVARHLPGSRVEVEIIHPLQDHWNIDQLNAQMDVYRGMYSRGMVRSSAPTFEMHLAVASNGRTCDTLHHDVSSVLAPEDYFEITIFGERNKPAQKAIVTIAGESAQNVGRDSRELVSAFAHAGETAKRGPLERVIACWSPISLAL